jgi:hypothetical protein
MQISKTVNDASLSDYCHLFDSEHQIAELKRLWELRTKHVSSFAHVSLLLDPRSKHRHFAQNEPLIVGDVDQKTWGILSFCVLLMRVYEIWLIWFSQTTISLYLL